MKRVARNFLGMFMAVLLVLLAACGGPAEVKSPYEQGLELVSLLEEMANNEVYITSLAADTNIYSILRQAGQGDFSQPEAVYRITVSADAVLNLAEMDLSGMSASLQENLKSRANTAIFSQINSLGGVETLAAASVCTAQKVFVSQELEEDEIYLYTYEDAVPVAVSFTPGEDGAVSATGMFVLYDADWENPEASIERLFSVFDVTVKEITQ
ncbi:MAG: hypothetical protein K2O45_02570 [Oscillospiraceae bacterium]|nr:hypothetical protein [Oscillospiraceae bacterium]